MSDATLTIDLAAIARNWHALDRLSAPTVETSAVVKANAYGLGIEKVAPALLAAGAHTFCVALASEAVALRQVVGPGPEILVFSGFMPGDAAAFTASGAIPMINSVAQFQAYASCLAGRPFGLQIDSGMNRLGLEPADIANLPQSARAAGHVISHLACADDPGHPMNDTQLHLFQSLAQHFPKAVASLAATGGTLLGDAFHFNMTRPGIGLFGGAPFADAQNVVSLDVPIIQTRLVAKGESVGYGRRWTAHEPTIIATISAGYADGLMRCLSKGAQVFAGDIPCPVVGRVSMDLITVDVSHIDDLPESLAILNGKQGIDDLANAAETLGYEVLTSLGQRYLRSYCH